MEPKVDGRLENDHKILNPDADIVKFEQTAELDGRGFHGVAVFIHTLGIGVVVAKGEFRYTQGKPVGTD